MKSQNNLPRAKTDWETPPELMEALRREYGDFGLDPCAIYGTKKALFHYGPDSYIEYDVTGELDFPKSENLRPCHDGLLPIWAGKVYVNPPYGRGIGTWVEKCCLEVQRGNAELVVALLPVSPDTRWWQTWVSQATEVRFLKGRVTFVGADGPAPFASAIVVWRRGMLGWHHVSYWDWRPK